MPARCRRYGKGRCDGLRQQGTRKKTEGGILHSVQNDSGEMPGELLGHFAVRCLARDGESDVLAGHCSANRSGIPVLRRDRPGSGGALLLDREGLADRRVLPPHADLPGARDVSRRGLRPSRR